MNDALLDATVWQNAATDSLDELATGMLGLDAGELLSVSNDLPEIITGAQVSMISLSESLNVGLTSSPAGCESLARALLGFEPDEELDLADINDALAEIINIVAGGIKQRMIETEPTIKIGLPVCFDGRMKLMKNVRSSVMDIKLGQIDLKIFLVMETQ